MGKELKYMKKQHTAILITILITFCVLAGCSNKHESVINKPLKPGHADKVTEHSNISYSSVKTIYQAVNDELELLGYYPEDYPIVKDILNTLEEYNALKLNIDYNTYEGNEWYDLYHSTRIQEAAENADHEFLKNSIQEAEFSTTYLGMNVLRVVIFETETLAVVDADVKTLLMNSTEEYLEEINAQIGDELVTPLQYILLKENGKWKIYSEEIQE